MHAGLGETIGTTAAFGFAIALLVSGLASTSVGTQVILSFGIPFALIPVVAFTRRRDLMGWSTTRSPPPPHYSWPCWWSRSTPSCSGRSSPAEPAGRWRRRAARATPASGPGPALSLTR
ncbi:hypothetical protein ADK66_05410 [Micromonospora sp. NRRL B-16802]|uniref:hypothetical protein n=1 Tax=Micromonospora sp. NRRL B-16802 TaxID=1415541 RepID=UPI0006B022EB|nr:hypothetical protein [Micromonospora sp. NRRL B-16802]KOX12280.1 hypothetical protein ADK66_05410 [Micromonospora sp. NRRL B-16802]